MDREQDQPGITEVCLGRTRVFRSAILLIALAISVLPHLAGERQDSAPQPVAGAAEATKTDAPPPAGYALLGWNDLGMHCFDDKFRDIAILPPYNTLWVQVIKVGDPPQIVTSGITVEYAFPENTYSAGKPGAPDKTDFWQYAPQLFHLKQPLPPNTGLAGKRLADTMDPAGDHYIAMGIPITPYDDGDLNTRHPYQKALVTVRDARTREILAQNTVVAPTSTEMECARCHSDTGGATSENHLTPTGRVETNILALHDKLNQDEYPQGHTSPLMDRRPVLCAECHASNALGMAGVRGVPSLSRAMHHRHSGMDDIPPTTDGCYNCHPGPQTRCQRDVMSQQFAMSCINCHGDMARVAQNPQPWQNEPRCSNAGCHGAGYATEQPLYRNSRGHGGVYCAGCHDSPHAWAPSREPNDGIKFMNLQGSPGPLRKCTTCHATAPQGPAGAFVHGKVK